MYFFTLDSLDFLLPSYFGYNKKCEKASVLLKWCRCLVLWKIVIGLIWSHLTISLTKLVIIACHGQKCYTSKWNKIKISSQMQLLSNLLGWEMPWTCNITPNFSEVHREDCVARKGRFQMKWKCYLFHYCFDNRLVRFFSWLWYKDSKALHRSVIHCTAVQLTSLFNGVF